MVERRGTRRLAESYVNFLYSPEGQDLAGRFYFRPRRAQAMDKFRDRFADLKLMNIDQFGGWAKPQQTHFADGGIFDQVYSVQTAGRP